MTDLRDTLLIIYKIMQSPLCTLSLFPLVPIYCGSCRLDLREDTTQEEFVKQNPGTVAVGVDVHCWISRNDIASRHVQWECFGSGGDKCSQWC